MSILEVNDLCKSFKGRVVVDNISFSVDEGDVYGFLGPNGSGKTTTIRMLLNLIHSDSGTVRIEGYDVKEDFKRAVKRVGAIVEAPRFYPYLSGRKNLELMVNLMGSLSEDSVLDVLNMVGLTDRADDRVKTYSLGMMQRLGIANALLNEPRLVILDEPTNGLDPQGMKEIRDLIIELSSKKNITFFISTHLLHEVELMCNKVAILNNGRIVYKGRVDDLVNENYEIVEVKTKMKELAFELIRTNDYVQDVKIDKMGVVVKIIRGTSSKLNRFLLSKNIEVDYLIPKNQSLEELFIDVVSGGDKND